MVFVSTRNLRVERPSKKLSEKWLGPFKILARMGQSDSFRLELPITMKIHDVFHASLLKKAPVDAFPSQRQIAQEPVVIDGEEEWELEAIVASRYYGRWRQLQYRAKWKGYDEDYTWYPAANFENAHELVEAFHREHPEAPCAAKR